MPDTTAKASAQPTRYKTVLAWVAIILVFLWISGSILGHHVVWTVGAVVVSLLVWAYTRQLWRMRVNARLLALMRAGEPRRAAEKFEALAGSTLRPANAVLHFNGAIARVEALDYERGIATLERLASSRLEVRPFARGHLVATLALVGQLERAEPMMDAMREALPDSHFVSLWARTVVAARRLESGEVAGCLSELDAWPASQADFTDDYVRRLRFFHGYLASHTARPDAGTLVMPLKPPRQRELAFLLERWPELGAFASQHGLDVR